MSGAFENPSQSTRRKAIALAFGMAMLTTSPHAAFANDEVALAWTPGMATPHLTVALADHVWEEEGLIVNPVPFASGRLTLEAMLGGGADFAAMSEFPAATAALQNQDFAIIAIISIFQSNKLIINGASGASDLESLEGRRVGLTMGTSLQYSADLLFDDAGVTVEFVNAAPSDLVPALSRGDVDAAFVFDCFYGAARATLGNDYVEVLTPHYNTHFVIATTGTMLRDDPQKVESFLRGLLAAEEEIQDTARTWGAITESTGGALTEEAILPLWDSFEFRVQLTEDLIDLLVSQGVWMNEQGLVTTPSTDELMSEYVVTAPLMAIDPGRVPQ